MSEMSGVTEPTDLIDSIDRLECLTEKKIRLLRELKRAVAMIELFPEIKAHLGKIKVSVIGSMRSPSELKLCVRLEDDTTLEKPLVEVPSFLRDYYLTSIYQTQGVHASKIREFFRRVDEKGTVNV
jgi:hypothetical protein